MWNFCRSLPLSLLIHASLKVLFLTAVACFDRPNDLILRPVNPMVEDGHLLTLNCTITLNYTGIYTNLDLHFRWGSVNYTNVTLVGNRTALLQRRWTLSEDGHVRCVLPDRPHTWWAIQHVTVVRQPLQPNVTRCSLWNWRDVSCAWEPSLGEQQEHMHTDTPLTQTVAWNLGDEDNDVWQDAVCRGEVTDSCTWNVSHIVGRFIEAGSCCVRVLARISLGDHLRFNVSSAQFCFRPVRNLILPKPQNLSAVARDVDQTYVHWQAPLLDPNHVRNANLVYAATVMSQWSDMPVINVSVMNQSVFLTSVPHTRYTVTVKVRTNESLIWSKPTYHVFTTESAVPKESPPSLPNAFTVTHVDRYTRTVVIYWRILPPQDRYGERLSYIVFTRRPPSSHWSELSVVPSADQPCKDVIVDADSAVELTVIARNEVGDSSPEVVLRLPAVRSSGVAASRFAKLVVEVIDSSVVAWTWQLRTSEPSAGLTLFWCQSQSPGGHCVDSIQWLDVAASEAEHNLSIGADDAGHYSYGAALKPGGVRRTETGGIEWVNCLYNMTGLAEPVHGVKAVVPSYGEPGQLLVTWALPRCDVRRGYIRSLMLLYCRRADGECVDEPRNVSLPGHRTRYDLEGLRHGAEYGVWMYSRTRAGRSRTHSDIIVAVTSAPLLTPAVIAGVVVSGGVLLVLAVLVVWMTCKYCRRCRDKLWGPVRITVPSATARADPDTYSSPSIREYTRSSYDRQVSRLSGSSNDSGQLGAASASPLVSPRSCSESVEVPLIASGTREQPPSAAQLHRSHPAARTYVNDDVSVMRRPFQNSHQRPPSSTAAGHTESFPLQPMIPRHTHDTAASLFLPADADTEADSDNNDDDDDVPGNEVHRRPNGGYHSVALAADTNYIPHEWLKM